MQTTPSRNTVNDSPEATFCLRHTHTHISFEDVVSFVRKHNFDGFLAVGGGSVMDTAKVANLMSCCPENELLDFVNAPFGKGQPIKKQLKPIICGESGLVKYEHSILCPFLPLLSIPPPVPTTAGTGSETTGVAVLDFKQLKAKTGQHVCVWATPSLQLAFLSK